jgi:hypothetical protein
MFARSASWAPSSSVSPARDHRAAAVAALVDKFSGEHQVLGSRRRPCRCFARHLLRPYEAIAPLRDRFVRRDVESVAGVSINVTGRDDVWSVAWHSALTSPRIGQGAGSSEIRLRGTVPVPAGMTQRAM